jgi:hypothetical protein
MRASCLFGLQTSSTYLFEAIKAFTFGAQRSDLPVLNLLAEAWVSEE